MTDDNRPASLVTWAQGLSVRVMVLLSVALLPVGLIALNQTREVSEQVRMRSELSLLALTEQAAAFERDAIQRAFGTTEALTGLYEELSADPAACSATMREYVEGNPRYTFLGFVPLDGQIVCSSAGTADVSQMMTFEELMERRDATVLADPEGPLSGVPVMVVASPFFDEEGVFMGHVAVSLPHAGLHVERNNDRMDDAVVLATFNRQGDLLTAEADMETALGTLPAGRELIDFIGAPADAFTGVDRNGEQRVFAVVPVETERVYAIGSWDRATLAASGGGFDLDVSTDVFPLLMWLASLVVANIAMHRLVIRHIRHLSGQMRRFALDRKMPEPMPRADLSTELRGIQNELMQMSRAIIEDEARQEDGIREKTILLKEVNHRVKNNLQMISSIMNMQIRKAGSRETQNVLRRLQDRVLGLATIHRNLYQAENLAQANAGQMVRDISGQLLAAGAQPGSGIKLSTDIDDLVLDPDQAVPLSLLVSEAATNAMKYVGGTPPRIALSLKALPGEEAELRVVNTVDESVEGMEAADAVESTGLGSQLIRAFANQLGARLETETTEGEHRLVVRFKIATPKPDPLDY